MKNGRRTSLVSGGGLLALLLLMLATSANTAWGKGPFLTSPPISITLYIPNNQEITLTQAQVTSIGGLIQTFPQLYNSSWRPAIRDLASRANQSLLGRWMSDIRLVVAQQEGSQQYVLTVYFGTISNGSIDESLHHSYPVDQELAQTLTKLDASVEVYFSLSGPYLTSQTEDEFFFLTDPYFHHLGLIDGQIAQSLTSQLGGKGFSWLRVSLLDENTVRIDGPINTIYFGTEGRVTATTQTVTFVSTESFTSTMLSTSTITQPPQTVTVTSTTSTPSNSNNSKSDYGANAVSGIVFGIAIALIASLATIALSRKR